MTYARDYVLRLPPPLAHLYGRAHDAEGRLQRHGYALSMLEALLKLSAAVGIAAYRAAVSSGNGRSDGLDEALKFLGKPQLGHWRSLLKETAGYFGDARQFPAHPLGHVRSQLEARIGEGPVTAFCRRIKNGVDAPPAGDTVSTLARFFDGVVTYRNAIAHSSPRPEAFYAEMEPLLVAAASDVVLGEVPFHSLGPPGSRLVVIGTADLVEGEQVEVTLRALIGFQRERLAPLRLPLVDVRGIESGQLAVLWPGHAIPLPLDPLVVYDDSGPLHDVLIIDKATPKVTNTSYLFGIERKATATQRSIASQVSGLIGRTISEVGIGELVPVPVVTESEGEVVMMEARAPYGEARAEPKISNPAVVIPELQPWHDANGRFSILFPVAWRVTGGPVTEPVTAAAPPVAGDLASQLTVRVHAPTRLSPKTFSDRENDARLLKTLFAEMNGTETWIRIGGHAAWVRDMGFALEDPPIAYRRDIHVYIAIDQTMFELAVITNKPDEPAMVEAINSFRSPAVVVPLPPTG